MFMGKVRVIAELTANDYRAARDFVQRVSDFVEATQPDTVSWEAFADESTGRWLWYEVFENEQALESYEQAVGREGMRDEARTIFEIVRITLLTPLADARLRDVFAQVGADEVRGVAGFAR
jgi:quinol monooxygenase YgiN